MNKLNSNTIITIGRTFGSGGSEIGKKVAKKLDIPFYDKELLEVEVQQSGGAYYSQELNMLDEKNPSVFFNSMAFNPYMGYGKLPLELMIQDIQINAIKSVANQGSCVIIGRRADKILRNEYDILSVFVSASIENRIERVSKRDGLFSKDSHKEILRADKIRRSYYNAYGEGDWGDASNYQLCINSGDLGIDNSVAMILQYLQLKGKLLCDEEVEIKKTLFT